MEAVAKKSVPQLLAEELGWYDVKPLTTPPNFDDRNVLKHIGFCIERWRGGAQLQRAYELLRDYKRADGEPFGPLFKVLEFYACACATKDIIGFIYFHGSQCNHFDSHFYAMLRLASRVFRAAVVPQQHGLLSPGTGLEETVHAALLLYVNDRMATQNDSKVEVPGTMLATWLEDFDVAKLTADPHNKWPFYESGSYQRHLRMIEVMQATSMAYRKTNSNLKNQLAAFFKYLNDADRLGRHLSPSIDELLLEIVPSAQAKLLRGALAEKFDEQKPPQKKHRTKKLLLKKQQGKQGIKEDKPGLLPPPPQLDDALEPLRVRVESIAAALRHLRTAAPAVQAFRDYNREHRDSLFEALGASARDAFDAWAKVDDPRRLPTLAEAEHWGQTFHDLLAGQGSAHRGAVAAVLALVRRTVEECGRDLSRPPLPVGDI
jgi:hypothetical protein